MKNLNSLLLLLTLSLVCLGSANHLNPNSEVRRLVENERAFCKHGLKKGTREGFLKYLADDSTIFRPGPVNGKKFWRDSAPEEGKLSWEPIYADISLACDLGFTTGPWEFRPNSLEDKPSAHGNYVSIWKRQEDESWKIVVDIETGNPAPTKPTPKTEVVLLPEAPKFERADIKAARTALLRIDESISRASETRGAVDAFTSNVVNSTRYFEPGAFPVKGRDAIRRAMSAKPGARSWNPSRSDVSKSGDMGYTVGSFEFRSSTADGETVTNGSYVRIWKRDQDGPWHIALEIFSPIPKPRATQ
jgi:ketosteroid isomerase-like protein